VELSFPRNWACCYEIKLHQMNCSLPEIQFIASWHQEWVSCQIWHHDQWLGPDALEIGVTFLIVECCEPGDNKRDGTHSGHVGTSNDFVGVWLALILWFTLHPSRLSCFVRVSCDNGTRLSPHRFQLTHVFLTGHDP
jgi:hypothetical protein